MRITLYTFCYNEKDIIPYFLNHYSKIVDKIVVYDNQSTDNSIELFKSFEGCEIEIRDYITNNEIQDDTLINVKNNCWKDDNSDYIMVVDIDEFIYHPNLREFLESHPNVDYFKPVGYDMVGDGVPTDYSKQIYEIIREGAPSINYSKKALFKRQYVTETGFSYGCHAANYRGKKPLIEYVSDGDLKLLHYKCIDLEYVIAKHKHYGDRRSNFNKKMGLGLHYGFSREKITSDFIMLRATAKKIV